MKISHSLGLMSLTLISTLVLTAPTTAAPVTFTDVTTFDTAVAGISGVDSNVIDFETFSGGDIISSGDTIQGVTFTPTLESPFELAIQDIGGTSGANTLGTSENGGTDVSRLALGETIEFSFSEATNAFGFFVIVSTGFGFIADDVTLSAGGTSITNPLGAIGMLSCGGTCNALFLGIMDDMASFTSATIQFGPNAGTFGNAFFELDDLKFTTQSLRPPLTPVPLPAALPLFAGDLGVLGLFGWRTKRMGAA